MVIFVRCCDDTNKVKLLETLKTPNPRPQPQPPTPPAPDRRGVGGGVCWGVGCGGGGCSVGGGVCRVCFGVRLGCCV